MQVVVNGVLTHYLLVNPGQKNTLLILHGWGQSSQFWQEILANIPENYTGLAVDLPAFGGTSPLPGKPQVSDYSEFVKNLIKKLELNNVFLLGHSFGGQIAVDFSLRYPQLLKHLTLLSPAAIRNDQPSLKSRLARRVRPLVKKLSPQIYQYLLSLTASSDYFQSSEHQRELLKHILHLDFSDKISSIKTPTSIIWGTEDHVIPNRGKFLAENIPNSKLFVLYGSDHSPHINSPQKFLHYLSQILTQYV